MRIVSSIREMQDFSDIYRRQGRTIGFVPTMGFLHEGHLSLIKAAKEENDVAVVSIFVNPTQFGPEEDFERYPRDFARDEKLCQTVNADVIFYPANKEMYPEGSLTEVKVKKITEIMCGKFRPGHFAGVCLVVSKLFNIVKPHRSYFGQKDYQQALVIKKMVEDLNFDLEVRILPTVREADGLAKSSRNVYLTAEERKKASILYQALMKAYDEIQRGNKKSEAIIQLIKEMIYQYPEIKIEYIDVRDAYTLEDVSFIDRPVVIALAVYLGRARLIDNIIVP